MVFDLLIYDPQGLRVLGGNDNAAGVPVDPVAQGGRKGVLPFGIPLFFLCFWNDRIKEKCLGLYL